MTSCKQTQSYSNICHGHVLDFILLFFYLLSLYLRSLELVNIKRRRRKKKQINCQNIHKGEQKYKKKEKKRTELKSCLSSNTFGVIIIIKIFGY